MSFNKKGMGIGQVFIFIIAAITFAVIMIFGYKAINNFLQSGEEVVFVQFKTSLESSIKQLYTEYGSVRVKEFTTPANFYQICFVDMNAEYDAELCTYNQAACSVWEDSPGYDSVDQNVFLKPMAGTVKIKVHDISIDPLDTSMDPDGNKNFLCVPIKDGYFTLIMEGKGDRTELSSRPPVDE